MSDFAQYLKRWEQAMRCGLMRGRPYSEPCIATYMYYVDWFLKTYHTISVPQFKQAMMDIPIQHFAKRLKLYEAINCLVRYLNDEGKIEPGYLEEVKRYKPKRHLPIQKKVVDEAGIEKLLAVCKTPIERMVIHLLSQTGLRATEAGNLLLEDIDLEKGYLVVKLAKWGKTRRVGLTAKAKESIEQYLSSRPEIYDKHFLIEYNRPMDRKSLLYCCRRLAKRSGVKVTPHTLRRAFVTINANKGRPLPMLQMACGHSDIATTRSYCLTTEDETVEAMQGWE